MLFFERDLLRLVDADVGVSTAVGAGASLGLIEDLIDALDNDADVAESDCMGDGSDETGSSVAGTFSFFGRDIALSCCCGGTGILDTQPHASQLRCRTLETRSVASTSESPRSTKSLFPTLSL